MKLICADDNAADQHLFSLACEEIDLSCEVITVNDGQELIDLISNDPEDHYEAFILDNKMPRLSGIDTLVKIREMNGPVSQVPVFLLSSSELSSDINKAYDAGVSAYVVKPIDFFDFIEKMKGMKSFWTYLNKTI